METGKVHKCAVCLADRLHHLSLWVLTLCGFGALLSLAVNVVTALTMFALERKQK